MNADRRPPVWCNPSRATHTIFMQFSQLTCNPFKICNPDAIQIDCARHPRIVCQLCSCSGGITSSLGCNSRSSQNCEVLWNCPWINQLLMEFPKWNGLRIDWRIVIGFLGMLWHRATLPQSSGLRQMTNCIAVVMVRNSQYGYGLRWI